MKKFNYKLKQKKRIVEEARSKERNLKPTAKKYKIQPNQIRRWEKVLEKLYEKYADSPKELKAALNKQTCHTGPPKTSTSTKRKDPAKGPSAKRKRAKKKVVVPKTAQTNEAAGSLLALPKVASQQISDVPAIYNFPTL